MKALLRFLFAVQCCSDACTPPQRAPWTTATRAVSRLSYLMHQPALFAVVLSFPMLYCSAWTLHGSPGCHDTSPTCVFASRQGACLVRSPSPRPVSRRRLSSPRRWTSRWSRFPPSPPHPSPGITTTNPSPPSLLRPNAGKHICCSGEAIECGWCSGSDGCTSLSGLSAHKHAHASPRPSATAQRR